MLDQRLMVQVIGWFAIVIAAAAPSVSATAEERTGRGYVMGGATLPQQGGLTGEAYQTYLRAPGARTRGWLVGAGVLVNPTVSLELELSATGVMRAREPTRYDTTVNEERRDRCLALAVRFHLRPNLLVGVEPLLGIALVGTRAWSQAEAYSHANPNSSWKSIRSRRRICPLARA